ncbi:MAG: AmmeMemoRadiSam system protein A [Firmicutes bacterium]|nr:AmmeMemoRadiSam system protein A [Bacillota bacterium]
MLKGYLIPHPPLIVEGIGKGDEIPKTRFACQNIAKEIAYENPETIVIITPHNVIYPDYFHISPGKSGFGDFEDFGAPNIKFLVNYNEDFAKLIKETASKNGILSSFSGEKDPKLDHGTMVPLYFLNKILNQKKIVRISLSGLSLIDHYKFGMCIKEASIGHKIVIIASGDMSHKLKSDGPYGFAKEGLDHDEFVKDCIERSDFGKLLKIPLRMVESASECGLRSLIVLVGAMDGFNIESKVLNYECPYGVGYLTASFTGSGRNDSILLDIDKNDVFVTLAKKNIENFIRTGEKINPPNKLSDEMNRKAGVFVSIKKNGELRGCIGTIFPTQENVALEILENSISAAVDDPRFDPIQTDELENLTYSVDILSPPETIKDKSELDVSRYGVIVSCGGRRGLLLPNIEGVQDVDEQISIALRKGGISQDESYRLERFEVVRHV